MSFNLKQDHAEDGFHRLLEIFLFFVVGLEPGTSFLSGKLSTIG